ncbi:hypothetical protein HYW68_01080 [Candidatus Parcubacteria bacterium]|nr:hypothetical protein [Candidatus Parcubacteria bacterium]
MGTLVLGGCEEPVFYETRIWREDRAALVGEVVMVLGYPQNRHPLAETIWDVPFGPTIMEGMKTGAAKIEHLRAGTYAWDFHALATGNAVIRIEFDVGLSDFTMRTSLEELRGVVQRTIEVTHNMIEQEVQRRATTPS